MSRPTTQHQDTRDDAEGDRPHKRPRTERLPLTDIDPQAAAKALARLDKGHGRHYKPATTNPTGCKLAQKAKNKGTTGWVKMKVSGCGRCEYYIHHLALVAAGRTADVELIVMGTHQASHRCHNPNCYEATHIVAEPMELNIARSMCKGWTWVRCACGLRRNPCKHTPRCILPR